MRFGLLINTKEIYSKGPIPRFYHYTIIPKKKSNIKDRQKPFKALPIKEIKYSCVRF